jgi:hypothetical protein
MSTKFNEIGVAGYRVEEVQLRPHGTTKFAIITG